MNTRTPIALCGMLVFAVCGSCAPETRVVRYKPWFAGLEGAQMHDKPVVPRELRNDPTGGVNEREIRTENPDKSVRLVAKTGRHLMIHIYNALTNEERELFLDQILSEMTKEEFRARGRDPAEAFEMLLDQYEDIIDLFNAIPQGENTPGVFLQPVGGKVFRMRATGLAARSLKLVAIDMVMEKGNWKLRWFVPR